MASAPNRTVLQRMFARKSIAQVQRETQTSELKRTLGKWNLLLLGVGCIIGAGIFVRTGSAAALHAGPAVMLSFVVAGIVCAFAGLCYAELSSTLSVWARFCCSNMVWPLRWLRLAGAVMWSVCWPILALLSRRSLPALLA
jgi:L-asparagine transporter-like permease